MVHEYMSALLDMAALTGIPLHSKNATKKSLWRGQNNLGLIVTEDRELFK